MRYHVKATMKEEKMGEFYQKLSDGTHHGPETKWPRDHIIDPKGEID
jgi:hypothetical protein